MPAPSRPRPRAAWSLGLAGSALAIAGLGVSTYLTVAHYGSPRILACSDRGTVDCVKVTTSSYAVQHGVPLAVLGLAFFAAALALQLPPAWATTDPRLRAARVGLSALGAGTALWLIWVELFRLDAICLYCTAVHVLAVSLFVLSVFGTAATPPWDPAPEEAQPGDEVLTPG